MTDATCETSSSMGKKGIDINDALLILSSRASAGGEKELQAVSGGASSVTDEHKAMGQTIDLFEWTKATEGAAVGCGCGSPPGHGKRDGGHEAESLPSEEKESDESRAKAAMEDERKQRRTEIRLRLETMSVSGLLSAVFEAQRERVTTYQEYDRGLDTVLKTGNITSYPAVCARATASFSVLSDTINTLKDILVEKHKRNDLAKLLVKLQQNEREKLNATAALHLERIRSKNAELGERNEGDERIAKLLREGVASLRAKVASSIEAINDVLEELRYAAAEENE